MYCIGSFPTRLESVVSNNGQEILDEVQNFDVAVDNVELLRFNNIEVDDDNDPLPENIVRRGIIDNNNVFNINWGFSSV